MKKIILILFITNNLFNQEKVTKVEYDFAFIPLSLRSENNDKFIEKAILYIKNNKSFYNINDKEEMKRIESEMNKTNDLNKEIEISLNSGDKKKIGLSQKDIFNAFGKNLDDEGSFISLDFENDIMIQKELVDPYNKDYYYIKEKVYSPKWELLDSVTIIDKHKCNYAKTHYYGREYYAWYCVELPFNKGPWKLNGLPGLIISVRDSKNIIFWNARKIKYNQSFNFPNLDDKKTISLSEAIIITKKAMKKFMMGIALKFSHTQKIDNKNIKINTKGLENRILEQSIIPYKE